MRQLLSRQTMRTSLYLLVLCTILPVTLAILGWAWHELREDVSRQQDRALALARAVAAQQSQLAESTDILLSSLTHLPAVQAQDGKSLAPLFQQLMRDHPTFANIMLLRPDGSVVASALPTAPGLNLADRRYFKQVMATRSFSAGEYVVGRTLQAPLFHLAAPVLNGTGGVAGILLVYLRLDRYDEMVSRISLPPGSRLMFLDHRGILLHRYPASPTARPGEQPPKALMAVLDAEPGDELSWEGQDFARTSLTSSFIRLRLRPDQPPYMTIVAGIPTSTWSDLLMGEVGACLTLLLLCLAVALGMAGKLGHAIIGEGMGRLSLAAEQLSAGNLATRVGETPGCREIRQLGATLDRMAEDLDRRQELQARAEECLRESEERFRFLFLALSEGVALHEVIYEDGAPADYRLLDVNRAYESILGIRREDAVGSLASSLYSQSPAPYLDLYAAVADGGGSVQFETFYAGMDRYFSISAVSPRQGQFVTVFEDITSSKRIQAEIVRSEQRFRAIFENAAVGIALMDSTGRYTEANKCFLEMLGYTREELLCRSFRDITHAEDLASNEANFSSAGRDPASPSYSMVKRYLRKDGTPLWVLTYGTFVTDQESGEQTSFSLIVDIDARMAAEQALATSEKRYRALFESASDTILLFKNGVVVDVNRAGLTAFNCGQDDLLGRAPLDLSAPIQPGGGDSKALSCLIAAHIQRGEPILFEWAHRRFDGSAFLSEVSLAPVDLPGEKLVLAHVRDITDRKRSEERYRVLFESAKDAILILKDGHFVDLNPAAADMFGLPRDEVIGLTPADVSPPRQPDGRDSAAAIGEIKSRVERGETCVLEWQHRRADGTEFPVELLPTRMHLFGEKLFLVFARDITERRRMQDMMIQSEKMMSLGGLAAGLAHEINNPLGIVNQGAQNIIRRIDPALPANAQVAERLGLDLAAVQAYFEERNILRYLQGIREAGERTAAIVANMLSFSRRSDSAKNPCDLGRILDRSLDIAASDYDLKKKYNFREVRIARDYDTSLPLVPSSATEIEQVILNLVRNAAQAMATSGTSEPRLTLRLMREGGWARIEVEDNGPGVPPDKLQRIFEPFYTTKRVGEGTGLGLSVSYYIITTNHHGQIFAESEPGKGTKFVILLPLADESDRRLERLAV